VVLDVVGRLEARVNPMLVLCVGSILMALAYTWAARVPR
jgi:hypothetical protein